MSDVSVCIDLGVHLRNLDRLRSFVRSNGNHRAIRLAGPRARQSVCFPKAREDASDFRQHDRLLLLVFALLIRVRDLTLLICLEEEDLGQPFIGVDLGWQGRSI